MPGRRSALNHFFSNAFGLFVARPRAPRQFHPHIYVILILCFPPACCATGRWHQLHHLLSLLPRPGPGHARCRRDPLPLPFPSLLLVPPSLHICLFSYFMRCHPLPRPPSPAPAYNSNLGHRRHPSSRRVWIESFRPLTPQYVSCLLPFALIHRKSPSSDRIFPSRTKKTNVVPAQLFLCKSWIPLASFTSFCLASPPLDASLCHSKLSRPVQYVPHASILIYTLNGTSTPHTPIKCSRDAVTLSTQKNNRTQRGARQPPKSSAFLLLVGPPRVICCTFSIQHVRL